MKRQFKEIFRYPTAVIGLVIILMLVAVSIYAVVTIPYSEAINEWRGSEDISYKRPANALPTWVNIFRDDKLPESLYIPQDASEEDGLMFSETTRDNGNPSFNYVYTIDFQADSFPQDITLYFDSQFEESKPFVTAMWYTPDGREIKVGNFGISNFERFRLSTSEDFLKKLNRSYREYDMEFTNQIDAMFADPDSVDKENPTPLKGTYRLEVVVDGYEEATTVSSELVMHGEVFGIAGTDHMRRDISVALLWGTPIALIFGLVAALLVSLLSVGIAAVGVWLGGIWDTLIQRLTEVNMTLPFLPIMILIGTFYSKSIWVILGATVALSIFGASIKRYRAIFLQLREAGYIEAAQTYGASSPRIVIKYLIPRVIPMLIPGLVLAVPSYVFLEAALAILGLGDPVLPTWGKLIMDANNTGALYNGMYYWILEPAVMLLITGFAFAMVGFSLDKIFNPRLREQ